MFTYHVIDTKTGRTVCTYPDTKGHLARAAAHRLDAKYGGVRYIVNMFKVTS